MTAIKTKSRIELMRALANAGVDKMRKHPSDEEHRLQVACVRWFRLQYPELAHALFAVPNGGRRDATTGSKLKAEGALAGVSDLILLKSNDKYGALLIEMKTVKGRQSDSQKYWEQKITKSGEYRYVVCRTFDEFKDEVSCYLSTSLLTNKKKRWDAKER